ncbi:HEAT repeat domain-containing protein [Streptomyces cylindrosporus]|uniref:HEAT repeat domain-containing protein n=1 Tax=Streptomyces cylindrosporus TaxID=2927583 RepID=A0ABS9YD91_9ACTN|nr:HEAT repeat domain-containing protein [Streptomyces cylindrosporus]MCI3275195.1 HEAT repeat domain-containing protein [Streptomyces cylindrosporus]
MLTGIDEVDWASLRHAYGSAKDVPGLLRGLASADPAEREVALDGMYGAVHHQGDVYDSTLACIPFLFVLAESAAVADRGGVVELLVSIGQEGEGRDDDICARAGAAVRAGAEAFVRLAGDPDAGVRRAAAGAVVRFVDRPERVLGLLRERITVERDDRVLLALAEGLGIFVRRHPGRAAGAVDLLTAQSAPPFGPGLRLAALGQLAGCAPDRLPADLVPTVVRLLRDRSETRPCRPGRSARPDTDTLVGRLRRLRPSDEEGSQLLRTLHSALGDRVADRIALLTGQLTSPSATDRCNAVWMSAGLLREWRADYREPVALIGAQLSAEEDRLRDAAASVLGDLFDLAAPAADALHALVLSRPDLWVRQWERGAPTLGGPLKALARTGDPRAVPELAAVLAGPVVPDDLGQVIVHLGPAAAPLAPALRERLAGVPLDSPELFERATPLLAALTALKDAESAPEVLRLAQGIPDGVRLRESVVESAVRALTAFGERTAVPVLRGLLDTGLAVTAAGALWSLEDDTDVVLPVLIRELTSERRHRRREAADTLARMGAAARPALPRLRRMADSDDLWERASAAGAVWRIDGDADLAAPILRAAWTANPHTRRPITASLAALGASGTPLHDLLRAELAAPRRHQAPTGGHGSHDVLHDEELLRACREVVGNG